MLWNDNPISEEISRYELLLAWNDKSVQQSYYTLNARIGILSEEYFIVGGKKKMRCFSQSTTFYVEKRFRGRNEKESKKETKSDQK